MSFTFLHHFHNPTPILFNIHFLAPFSQPNSHLVYYSLSFSTFTAKLSSCCTVHFLFVSSQHKPKPFFIHFLLYCSLSCSIISQTTARIHFLCVLNLKVQYQELFMPVSNDLVLLQLLSSFCIDLLSLYVLPCLFLSFL